MQTSRIAWLLVRLSAFAGAGGAWSPGHSEAAPPDTAPALVHARRANDFINQRKPEEAFAELTAAEQMGQRNGFETEPQLFQAYRNRHDFDLAFKRCQRCVTLCRI